MENQLTTEIDELSNSSMKSNDENSTTESSKMMWRRRQVQSFYVDHLGEMSTYLEKVRDNSSNRQCADCDDEDPTIAILSWLLVICKRCAGKFD